MPQKRAFLPYMLALCVLMPVFPAWATPDAAPPKKPDFGAFRMQPILEPHLVRPKPEISNETAQPPAPTSASAAPTQPYLVAPSDAVPPRPAPNPNHSLGTLTLRPSRSLNTPTLQAPTPQETAPSEQPAALAAPAAPSSVAAPTTPDIAQHPTPTPQPLQKTEPQLATPPANNVPYLVAPAPIPPVAPAPTLAAPTPAAPQSELVASPTPEPQAQPDEYSSAAISPAGLPLPVRKPSETTERTLFERLLALPVEPGHPLQNNETDLAQEAPHPAQAQPDTDADAETQGVAQTEIIDEDNDDEINRIVDVLPENIPQTPMRLPRLNHDQRMAGSSVGSVNMRGSLIPSMQDIRIRPLQEAKGESPIIIPGLQKAAIPRAPDIPRSIDQTRPDEVILFFEENSNRLEAGQMAVIHTDVIELLRRRPELKVDIIGYAEDNIASDVPPSSSAANTAEHLSKARALMVRDYLIRNKIESSRIMVTGRANKTKIEPRDRADLFFVR